MKCRCFKLISLKSLFSEILISLILRCDFFTHFNIPNSFGMSLKLNDKKIFMKLK